MSVLLVGLDPTLAASVARRLLAQGDEVRVVAPAGQAYEGVHVAVGDPGDDDLVERAAQGARTVVVGTEGRAAALTGAARAGVERAILVGGSPEEVPPAMSWVVLVVRRRSLAKRGPSPDAVAEAVDAADDLAGEPRIVADLSSAEGWRALRLDPR